MEDCQEVTLWSYRAAIEAIIAAVGSGGASQYLGIGRHDHALWSEV